MAEVILQLSIIEKVLVPDPATSHCLKHNLSTLLTNYPQIAPLEKTGSYQIKIKIKNNLFSSSLMIKIHAHNIYI
jgi:hypothetical protein